jgi:hypothetical protein
MALSPETKLFMEQLDLLKDAQILNMTPSTEQEKAEWLAGIQRRDGHIREKYLADVKELEQLDKDSDRAKEINRNIENLSKAIPGLTKGTLAAISAFQKGDVITGTSAVMGICSSMATLIGGISAAGGPPGMLIGAIFGMVAEILSFFGPKGESLKETLEKLLRQLTAEQKQQDIDALHTDITNYAKSLRIASATLAKSQNGVAVEAGVVTQIIQDFNPLRDLRDLWKVGEWLNLPANQPLDGWPIVLCALCHAYDDLIISQTMLLAYANNEKMREWYEAADKIPGKDASDKAKAALESLRTLVKARLIEYAVANQALVVQLKKIMPAARDRGIFWLRTDTSFNPYICAGDNIGKALTPLVNFFTRTAVATSKGAGAGYPELHVFGVESSYNNNEAIRRGGADRNTIYYGKLNSPYTDLSAGGWKPLQPAPGFHSPTDIWATTGLGTTAVFFYVAKGNDIYGYAFDAQDSAPSSAPAKVPVYHKALKSEVTTVRVVRAPESLLEDPDAGPLPGLLHGVDAIVYAGLKSSTEIYVDGKGADGYVPGPTGWGPYSGIAVDQHYLWTWGWGGPACATHASVLKCLAERAKGNMITPRWIQNQVPAALKHMYPQFGEVPQGRTAYGHVPANRMSAWSDNPPPPKGLTDLCACDDGSLFAGVYERTVAKEWALAQGNYWAVQDTLALYTGVHTVHLKEGTMDVDWKVNATNTGVRIQKLPIHCWPAITSTIRLIEQLDPVLK